MLTEVTKSGILLAEKRALLGEKRALLGEKQGPIWSHGRDLEHPRGYATDCRCPHFHYSGAVSGAMSTAETNH